MNTTVIEAALRAASGVLWQQLGLYAAGTSPAISTDYFDTPRAIIAAYLRQSGRYDEAREVEAIGCNEPAPKTGFGMAAVRDAMGE